MTHRLPLPRPGTAHVWVIHLDVSARCAAALRRRALPAGELTRLTRIDHPGARHRFAVTRGVARVLLGRYLGRDPRSLRWTAGRWGKPELAEGGLRFSVSHSGDLGLLAVTRRRAVGVDVEFGRAGLDVESLAGRYFPRAESDLVSAAGPARRLTTYLRLWTRKEACVKAAGERIVDGLGLAVGGSGPLVRGHTGRLRGVWTVRDLAVGVDHVAALAVAGGGPCRVVVRVVRAGVSPAR
nr:4'-phosphopantetheinyl transferase superfamily protein [Micromonospora sp. DSM 115978]